MQFIGTSEKSSSKSMNHIISSMYLPTPGCDYPYLDILGSAISTTTGKKTTSKMKIAENLSHGLLTGLGIKIHESFLFEPIKYFEEHPPSSTTQSSISTGGGGGDGSGGSSGNVNLSPSEDLSSTLEKLDISSNDEQPSDSNAAAAEMPVNTHRHHKPKLRQQLVLVLEADLGDRVLAHRATMRLHQGSGVCDMNLLLSSEEINNLNIDEAAGIDNGKEWSSVIVPEETKAYSMEQRGTSVSNINPDFGKLYHSALKADLVALLASDTPAQNEADSLGGELSPFAQHVANSLPTIFWGGVSSVERGEPTDLVFLTVGIPASADVKLVKSSDGHDIISICPDASLHPDTITIRPRGSPQQSGMTTVACQFCGGDIMYNKVDFARRNFAPPKTCKECKNNGQGGKGGKGKGSNNNNRNRNGRDNFGDKWRHVPLPKQ